MANEIVWYDSTETGAPTLNNAPGSLNAVLHACLVTGFRTITLDSVTVTANVATATFFGGHGYGNQRMVDLSGAGTALINGRKLITVTGASTFTFPAPGVSNGTISGTIAAIRSPLGWTRPHSSGNVAIYQRSDPTATAMALRVDDSFSAAIGSDMIARALMVESFTSLADFTSQTPTVAQIAGGGVYWYKGSNTGSSKRWILVGDSKRFYLFSENGSSPFSGYFSLFPFGFGDLNSFRAGDAYCAFIAGSEGLDTPSYAFRSGSPGATPTAGGGFFLARPANQIGSSVPANSVAVGVNGQVFGQTGPAYPSYVDNGFVAGGPVYVSELNSGFGSPLRGTLPGVSAGINAGIGRILFGQVFSSLVGTDRSHLLVGINSSGSSSGAALIDITGPW